LGPLAQSVEQRTFNPWVVGSIPTGPTKINFCLATLGVGGKIIKVLIYSIGRRVRYIIRWSKKFISRFKAQLLPGRIFIDSEGYKFILNRHNALDKHVFQQGALDLGLPYRLSQICDLDSIAIDVGANKGYYTIPFASKFLQVHSFEPNPVMKANLDRNIAINNFQNIISHGVAVSDKNTEVDFFIQNSIDGDNDLNTGLSSLKLRPEYLRKTIPVLSVTLDSMSFNLPVGIIKIDVEGSEFDVLKGARKVIQLNNPIVLWEGSIRISIDNYLNCLSFFSDLGYRTFEISKSLALKECFESDTIPDHDFNYLSVPNSQLLIDLIQTKFHNF
jgi:FkbM family methyltransferase